MKLEYTATANCSIEQASAYFNNLAAYCKVHALKGTEFTIINPTLVHEKRSISKISWQSTHQLAYLPFKIEDIIVDGEGKGTIQTIILGQSLADLVAGELDPRTTINYTLEPVFTTLVSKAMFKALGEKKAQKMMLEALKKSTQLDIEYLEKLAKSNG